MIRTGITLYRITINFLTKIEPNSDLNQDNLINQDNFTYNIMNLAFIFNDFFSMIIHMEEMQTMAGVGLRHIIKLNLYGWDNEVQKGPLLTNGLFIKERIHMVPSFEFSFIFAHNAQKYMYRMYKIVIPKKIHLDMTQIRLFQHFLRYREKIDFNQIECRSWELVLLIVNY